LLIKISTLLMSLAQLLEIFVLVSELHRFNCIRSRQGSLRNWDKSAFESLVRSPPFDPWNRTHRGKQKCPGIFLEMPNIFLSDMVGFLSFLLFFFETKVEWCSRSTGNRSCWLVFTSDTDRTFDLREYNQDLRVQTAFLAKIWQTMCTPAMNAEASQSRRRSAPQAIFFLRVLARGWSLKGQERKKKSIWTARQVNHDLTSRFCSYWCSTLFNYDRYSCTWAFFDLIEWLKNYFLDLYLYLIFWISTISRFWIWWGW